MKKILFAFLLSMSFVFAASASNDVIFIKVSNPFMKIKNQKMIFNTSNYKISKNKTVLEIVQYCSYGVYENGGIKYNNWFCACDVSDWCNEMDKLVKLIDQLASFSAYPGGH